MTVMCTIKQFDAFFSNLQILNLMWPCIVFLNIKQQVAVLQRTAIRGPYVHVCVSNENGKALWLSKIPLTLAPYF